MVFVEERDFGGRERERELFEKCYPRQNKKHHRGDASSDIEESAL